MDNNPGETKNDTTVPKEKIQRPPEYATWTQCKKDSWDQLEANPNAFYYRHLYPGETRKNGAWSEDEKKLFVEALRKTEKINQHWGLFSRNIPGRVGYQCHQQYLRMVETGELQKLAPELQLPPHRTNDTSKKWNHIDSSQNTSSQLDQIEDESLYLKQPSNETNFKEKLKSPMKSPSSSQIEQDILYF